MTAFASLRRGQLVADARRLTDEMQEARRLADRAEERPREAREVLAELRRVVETEAALVEVVRILNLVTTRAPAGSLDPFARPAPHPDSEAHHDPTP